MEMSLNVGSLFAAQELDKECTQGGNYLCIQFGSPT